MLSLRSIWREADGHLPTIDQLRARSFGTEVPQDDAVENDTVLNSCPFVPCTPPLYGVRY